MGGREERAEERWKKRGGGGGGDGEMSEKGRKEEKFEKLRTG